MCLDYLPTSTVLTLTTWSLICTALSVVITVFLRWKVLNGYSQMIAAMYAAQIVATYSEVFLKLGGYILLIKLTCSVMGL